MDVAKDKTGQVQDEVLHVILSMLPIKSMARAAAVCQRWNYLLHTLCLHPLLIDLRNEFSSGTSRGELVGTLRLLPVLTRGNKVKRLILSLDPSFDRVSGIDDWFRWFAEKSKKLELDFCIVYGRPSYFIKKLPKALKTFKLQDFLFESRHWTISSWFVLISASPCISQVSFCFQNCAFPKLTWLMNAWKNTCHSISRKTSLEEIHET